MDQVDAGDGQILPAADHSMNMFLPHLLFGMNFFSYLSCDLALLRGKVGCRLGAFMLYYPCRYLSLLSMISFLVYYDALEKARLDVLTYISQAASTLSLGFALSILVIRISILYKNKYLTILLPLMMVALWGVLLRNMVEGLTQPAPPDIGPHAAMAILMLCIPTSGLVLALFYVLVVAKHEHNFRVRDCLRMMWDTDVAEFALICVIAVPSTVFYLLDLPGFAWSHLSLGYSSFVTTTITAARIYRKMIRRLDSCPVNLAPPQVYGWLKQGAIFVASKLGLRSESSASASSQAHQPNGAPQLGSQRASQSLTLSILSGRQRPSNRVCLPAHSRSTYAQTSLYESQPS
ncbi:hypothetical protein LXA43DRAFT_1095495 [Ganoderma leucocontextum]|nr:hypothetical protein LXA43DRAFT_1095495 [Ganoderma leucocontextum]